MAQFSASPEVLSARERQVVALLSQGLSQRRVAALLSLGLKTVDAHRQSSYDKLGIHNRVQLARWALQHGVDV